MDIAEQIKKIRKEKGLFHQDIALRLSMNKVQYNRIETGQCYPSMNVLQRIARVLDINVVEFFEAKKRLNEALSNAMSITI